MLSCTPCWPRALNRLIMFLIFNILLSAVLFVASCVAGEPAVRGRVALVLRAALSSCRVGRSRRVGCWWPRPSYGWRGFSDAFALVEGRRCSPGQVSGPHEESRARGRAAQNRGRRRWRWCRGAGVGEASCCWRAVYGNLGDRERFVAASVHR